MAVPPQTPGYQSRLAMRIHGRIFICVALLAGGIIVIAPGNTVLTTFGVVLIGLGLMLPVRWLIALNEWVKKDRALREPGTVQLLTTVTSPIEMESGPYWELTGDIQIRLDSGHTFTGSYTTMVPDRHPAGVKPAWFRVGASLLCQYNPTNPDRVLVFPFAARGDEVTYDEIGTSGPEHVWFSSATRSSWRQRIGSGWLAVTYVTGT